MFQSKSNLLAVLIIAGAVALAIFSVKDDTITTDESPHISAGYSYLTQQDMRLNPEHPPLIKDLAALPLLFQKINFDADHSSWKNDVNGQWSFGPLFFYEIGNNPDTIAFAARLAVLILFILLCWLVYKWGSEKYGRPAGLIALFLTAFSPNIIAHAHYVTTDVGAALGFLAAIYFFVKFINQPSKNNLIYAGVAFGLAQLLKFSLILLLPLYVFIFIVLYFIKHSVFDVKRSAASLLAILVVGYALVWPVYQFHVWNYPPERQKSDTQFHLSNYPFKPAGRVVIAMTDKPFLRPYAQYLLGLLMVFQRTGGGNTTYYWGEVSSTAWKSYFPVVYALKEPIPVLILMAIVLASALIKIAKSNTRKFRIWILQNTAEFTWLSFIALYWASSVSGNLNIGLRHVLPTFPFIYLLTAGQIQKWFKKSTEMFGKTSKNFFVSVLLVWLVIETLATFPYYLAYFNEIAGGPANGYKYVADSNLDWGQDLKRLSQYIEANNIDQIKLDYFGGGSPQYYLGDKYEKLDAGNASQRQDWLAVSATLLQGGRAEAIRGFDKDTTYYKWLDNYEPIAKIGYSIFVYKLE